MANVIHDGAETPRKRTPMEMLRSVVEEQGTAECDALHELHGDKGITDCYGRQCYACTRDAMRKAADLVEAELDALKARTLPEGMEWPCYEDGEPVLINDVVLLENGLQEEVYQIHFYGSGFALYTETSDVDYNYGERVKRPAPPVLAADGEPIEPGQVMWHTESGERCTVIETEYGAAVSVEFEPTDAGCRHTGIIPPNHLTHKQPVLAADGEPLEVGQTVYWDNDDSTYTVKKIEGTCVLINETVSTVDAWTTPNRLTHQRPVLDADGNCIETGMDVWWVCDGDERGIHAEKLHVDGIDDDGEAECSPYGGGTSVVLKPSELHVNKPVLDADGVQIKKGDTVYLLPGKWCDVYPCCGFHGGEELEVRETYTTRYKSGVILCWSRRDHSMICYPQPSHLTHAKPEPSDSWEKWREEFIKTPCVYCRDILGVEFDDDTELDKAFDAQVQDMERRARALAERGE